MIANLMKMIVFRPYADDSRSLSHLYRAWEKYYAGLGYNKKLKKVNERVRKGKMPTEKTQNS